MPPGQETDRVCSTAGRAHMGHEDWVVLYNATISKYNKIYKQTMIISSIHNNHQEKYQRTKQFL